MDNDPMLQTLDPGLSAWLPRRVLTVADYYKMAEAGILTENDRVELIEGQIIEMVPIGSEHAGKVNNLTYLLITTLGSRAVVSVQNPVRLITVHRGPVGDAYTDVTERSPRDTLDIAALPGSTMPAGEVFP